MAARLQMIGFVVVLGCADAPPIDPSLALVEKASATGRVSFVHVGGLCTRDFTSSKKGDAVRLARFSGVESVDAQIDQRESMSSAVGQMRDVLDDRCTGADWCYLYGHSNGAAVISRTLALHPDDRWNVLWVLNAASNEGGSELSASIVADLADVTGLKCNLANNVGPTDHRAGWNHNDTAGNAVYHVVGYKETWYTGGFPDFFDGMANDGAVAYHSAAGLNDVWFVSDDAPWACYARDYHYDQHYITSTCEGFDLDHDAMQLRGVIDLGG